MQWTGRGSRFRVRAAICDRRVSVGREAVARLSDELMTS